jgi:hypothetical protein
LGSFPKAFELTGFVSCFNSILVISKNNLEENSSAILHKKLLLRADRTDI